MRTDVGDFGLVADGDFVHTVDAVDNEGARDAEFREGAAEFIDQSERGDADHLRGGSGGIRERAKEVEYGAPAGLAARCAGMLHGGVHGGSEEEADAERSDGFADALARDVELHAEGFEHIGRTAAGAEGAIAVFGDARARSCGNEGRGGRDVEGWGVGAGGVASGAAGVYQWGIGVCREDVGVRGHHRVGVAAHGAREADQFVDGFALIAQGDEQANDVGVVQTAFEQFLHERFGFGGGEVLAGLDYLERGGDHVGGLGDSSLGSECLEPGRAKWPVQGALVFLKRAMRYLKRRSDRVLCQRFLGALPCLGCVVQSKIARFELIGNSSRLMVEMSWSSAPG